MIPLNKAHLCPDCDTIFSIREQIHPHTHYPICPICGTKNALSLSRILNRKEEKDETPNRDDIVGSSCAANGPPGHYGPSGDGS